MTAIKSMDVVVRNPLRSFNRLIQQIDELATACAAQDSPEAILARDHSGCRLLLVEDEPINQSVALDMLNDAGLKADVANNGPEAVEKIRETDFDLIQMDLHMLKLDVWRRRA